jgi:hypothetical protein
MKIIRFTNAIVSLVFVFLFFIDHTNATILNTKTGEPIVEPSGTIVVPPVTDTNPLWLEAIINNGWNGHYIGTIGAYYGATDFYAQSFTATMTSITKFGVVILQDYPVGELRLGITTDNGGVPDYASPLYLGTAKIPDNTGKWYFETGVDIPVIPGEKYYVLLDAVNVPGATGYDLIGLSSNCPIDGKGIIFSNNDGVNWITYPEYPLAIYVEGVPAPVPVPYWAIILVFVVIGGSAFYAYKRKLAKSAS